MDDSQPEIERTTPTKLIDDAIQEDDELAALATSQGEDEDIVDPYPLDELMAAAAPSEAKPRNIVVKVLGALVLVLGVAAAASRRRQDDINLHYA